jgi:hypothetical protein
LTHDCPIMTWCALYNQNWVFPYAFNFVHRHITHDHHMLPPMTLSTPMLFCLNTYTLLYLVCILLSSLYLVCIRIYIILNISILRHSPLLRQN